LRPGSARLYNDEGQEIIEHKEAAVPKAYPHSHACHGHLVGFSVKKFGGSPTFFVCFNDAAGRRLKRDTNQPRVGGAVESARLIIEKEYAPGGAPAEALGWEDALVRLRGRLATAGLRESTAGYYLKLLRLVRKACPAASGPGDVTAADAARLRDTMMSTPGRRKKLPSAHYVAGVVVGLSALWQKWFVDDLKLLRENPWERVEAPKADRPEVRYATDEMIAQFYEWVAARFGDWPFPKLFLSAKAFTGCRLMDLCALKSGQLRAGRLVFPPGLTKGRKERAVPVPAELFAALDAFKGGQYLWENYLPGLTAALRAAGFPAHQVNPEFAPQRLYYWVEALFADYRKAFPGRPHLTTHMFRKRAFTMAWNAGVDARRASIAYGCNVDTMLKHYVLLDEQQVTDDVFARMRESGK
jgi:integrase